MQFRGASSRRKEGIELLMLLLEYSPTGFYSPRERIINLLLFRVPYALAGWIHFSLFTIQTIVSWILRDYGGYSGCQSSSSESDQVVCGPLAVLRISMGSFLFFGLMVLVTIGVNVEDEDDWSQSKGQAVYYNVHRYQWHNWLERWNVSRRLSEK